MMENTLYISKTRKLLEDEDFSFLRTEGLEYIEGLASKLWTDYNTHDPGITIMEALSYAITELGYRTSFDIKDLMSDDKGRIYTNQAFFSAKNILPNNPLTVTDFRKLLADIVGIKNAFLYPYRDEELNLIDKPKQEVAIYAHCKEDRLRYEETEHSIQLHGLYRVVLDLEETDELGNLNTGNIIWQFSIAELLNYKLELLFPNWNEVDYEFIASADPTTVSILTVTLTDNEWEITYGIGTEGDVRQMSFNAHVLLKKNISDIAILITAQFSDNDNMIEIFKLYQKKIQHTINILNEAKSTLHQHRNLCEDFIKLETICTQEIAFCADIEVKPDADIEEVYAQILFQLENYINPEVKFYSLKELLNEGVSTDKIFEGPILKHGFIKTDEMEITKPRIKIYISDIINFIMDTEGVLTVKNVLLTKYNTSGDAELPSQRWCLEIENGCKAFLNSYKSKVLFFKGKLPFKAKLDEVFDTLKYLHGVESRSKLKGTADDLEMPTGNDRDLDDYISVQYEFPITYRIGNAGLPSNSSDERKAQSKQLKAYLLFYDQILANFFSQLNHAKDLFSTNKEIKQTYFAQFINDPKVTDGIYQNAAELELIFKEPQDGEPSTITQKRAALLESKDLFYDRRNRFLDHLSARFAESFNDYVLMLYTYKKADEYEEIDIDELFKDKIDFLNSYPVISSERGKAFSYLQKSWIEEGLSEEEINKRKNNVSGFEKRIAKLAGIDDYSRRFLFCLKNIEIQKKTVTDPETGTEQVKYFFNVIDENGNTLLKSIKEYDEYSELEDIVQKIPDHVTDINSYHTIDISESEFLFEIHEGDVALAKSDVYTNAVERDAAIDRVIELMKKECPTEGMHLIEHILLRPRFAPPEIEGLDPEDVYKLFEVCLNENCIFCGEEDPYSFRMSLILPYWHERFRSLEFRKYFETIARTEAPAHCMIRICWINNILMNEFERAYKAWLQALEDYESDLIQKDAKKDRLRIANNNLIDIIKKLHSEYPEAQLHDCETSVTNPVLLGSTILGTF